VRDGKKSNGTFAGKCKMAKKLRYFFRQVRDGQKSYATFFGKCEMDKKVPILSQGGLRGTKKKHYFLREVCDVQKSIATFLKPCESCYAKNAKHREERLLLGVLREIFASFA
jgi:hypothetical protein